MKNSTLDTGNNETLARGVFAEPDGTFLAMTFTRSRTFKTRAGADRWYARQLGADNARAMVGCACYHDGEHGVIVDTDLTSYEVPMLRVKFGERIATLRPSEIGAR